MRYVRKPLAIEKKCRAVDANKTNQKQNYFVRLASEKIGRKLRKRDSADTWPYTTLSYLRKNLRPKPADLTHQVITVIPMKYLKDKSKYKHYEHSETWQASAWKSKLLKLRTGRPLQRELGDRKKSGGSLHLAVRRHCVLLLDEVFKLRKPCTRTAEQMQNRLTI